MVREIEETLLCHTKAQNLKNNQTKNSFPSHKTGQYGSQSTHTKFLVLDKIVFVTSYFI
jgi:hypothetical protein